MALIEILDVASLVQTLLHANLLDEHLPRILVAVKLQTLSKVQFVITHFPEYTEHLSHHPAAEQTTLRHVAALLDKLVDRVVVVHLHRNAVNHTYDHIVAHGEQVTRVNASLSENLKTLGSLLSFDNHTLIRSRSILLISHFCNFEITGNHYISLHNL